MVETSHLFRAEIALDPPIDVGEVPGGYRRIIPIKGGTISGRINGKVLRGGADWNMVRSDGATVPVARYTLQTDDGVLIMVTNVGIMPPAPDLSMQAILEEEADLSQIYCWGTPRFEVAVEHEKYRFLNERIFLAKLTPVGPLDIILDFHEVL